MGRKPGLSGQAYRRIHGAVATVGTPLHDLEEKPALQQGLRIYLEELGAALAIIKNMARAQPGDLALVEIRPRLEIVVVVLRNRQKLDAVRLELLDRSEYVVGPESDVLNATAEALGQEARRQGLAALRGVEDQAKPPVA